MQGPNHRRILVVDDNRAIHADFAKILTTAAEPSAIDALEAELFGDDTPAAEPQISYTIGSAYQGQEALAMVRASLAANEPYAMAFVDMRMPPGWNGVETIEKLWEVDPDLQIVICTAYSDYSWEEILARLGVSDRLLLLKKPFDTAEVCQLACALTEKWFLARNAHLKLAQLRGMVDEQTADLAKANLKLQASEARYALAAAGANDGLWDWDVPTGTVHYSPRWYTMIGARPSAGSASPSPLSRRNRDAHAGRPSDWFERVHEEDHERFVELFTSFVGTSDHIAIEYRLLHEDGQYRWMLCRGVVVRDEDGKVIRAAGSQTDITDRKLAEAQLRHAAFHDGLTGLPNRALLGERLARCIVRKQRHADFRFAVMFIDLDRFKVINDSLGHLIGDALLVELSKRLSSCIRATDTLAFSESNDLARIGGDEFVLLVEGLHDDADILRVAERIQACIADPFLIDGNEIHASMSMGIALGRPEQSADDIIRDADTALYRAKEDGRGRYRVFSEDLHASAVMRWQMENELRRAIENDELYLQYQPIVGLGEGVVEHFEALVRWRHPVRGFVSPLDFIPLAEETGLIVPLGRWVLDRACRQVKEWRESIPGASKISVAINVASKQLVLPSFVGEVQQKLADLALTPDAIAIEVTESSTMNDVAVASCKALLELGYQIHLDDFGTGYSSLSYLNRMPITALKIDRSFTATMVENPMSASIVQTIVTLARILGIASIAEGVESVVELELLKQMGCSNGQGYFWARPLDPANAAALLRTATPSLPPPGSRAPTSIHLFV